MTLLPLPWLELALAGCLVGGAVAAVLRTTGAAWRWCVGVTGLVLACTVMELLAHTFAPAPGPGARWQPVADLVGRPLFAVDELSAPLLGVVALLHFLTVLATARSKMARLSYSGLLFAEALRLATFGCTEPWALVTFLILGLVPAYLELRARGRPTRMYTLHMGLFAGLLVVGWSLHEAGGGPTVALCGAVMLLAATLVRCGTVPVHCWVPDLFESASFGGALLFVTPIAGAYLAMRLVLPEAPEWVLRGISVLSLTTAVYAAGMALVQREARRFFAYLFLSHASLVLVGLEIGTAISLTGALALWFSVALSLGGLGLTLRALEARFGRLRLDRHLGLYEHSPALAGCFLLTGLASVGFPGTLGFISAELLVDGAIGADPSIGAAVVLAGALNGIAIVRAYFLLFTGAQHDSSVPLGITPRERFAVLTLAALILGGGLFPQPGIASRHAAAEALLRQREGKGHLAAVAASRE